MSPRAVLVGPPGAGKTTVGQLLAEALGVPFRDTDADIEATAGKPISDIFVDDGEDHFRALERAAVAAALESFDGVLALGGGAVLADETRAAAAGPHGGVPVDRAGRRGAPGRARGRPSAAGGQPAGHPEVPARPATPALRGGRHDHRGDRRPHPEDVTADWRPRG